MPEKTKKDVINEAIEKTGDFKENFNLTATTIIKNSAIIVIILLVIIYSYNIGFLKEYNIPANYIIINLQNYIYDLIKLSGLYIFVVFYYAKFKRDRLLNRNKINFVRIFMGFNIFYFLLIENDLGGWIGIAVSLGISIVIETFAYLKNKPRKNPKIAKEAYQIVLEDTIENSIIHILTNRISLIIVIVILAPYWGSFKANSKKSYEICNINNQNYAIIIDYSDKAIVQAAVINDTDITISTHSYKVIAKDNIEIQYKEFKNVIIQKEK